MFCALVVVVIGGVYYDQDYKPRHYLRDWSQQVGMPSGRFSGGVVTGDNHSLTMEFSEQCVPSIPCDPTPVKAVKDWAEHDGGYLDDDTIARCFRDGESFTYYHGHHVVEIDCDPVNTVQFEYRFTARITY